MVRTLEDQLANNKLQYMEHEHYAFQLNEHLNSMREEAAIQVTKIKDFAECQKSQYADYIQLLEQQLAKSRALACAELKKRDHVSCTGLPNDNHPGKRDRYPRSGRMPLVVWILNVHALDLCVVEHGGTRNGGGERLEIQSR